MFGPMDEVGHGWRSMGTRSKQKLLDSGEARHLVAVSCCAGATFGSAFLALEGVLRAKKRCARLSRRRVL